MQMCDDGCDCEVRLAAAMDLLALSSARLKAAVLSGADDAIDSASTAMRLAKVRFLSAEADCRETSEAPAACQFTARSRVEEAA